MKIIKPFTTGLQGIAARLRAPAGRTPGSNAMPQAPQGLMARAQHGAQHTAPPPRAPLPGARKPAEQGMPQLHQPLMDVTAQSFAYAAHSPGSHTAPVGNLQAGMAIGTLGGLHAPEKPNTTPATPESLQLTPDSQAFQAKPNIAGVMDSKVPKDVEFMDAIFSDKFRLKKDWNVFMNDHLKNGSVSAQLHQPAHTWNPQSFQALFMASWANHPTEKGAYVIDLSGLPKEQVAQIRAGMEKSCKSRKSSHLDGKGYSAANGFDVLKGYKELLVQMPMIDGKPCLYLKAEGSGTDLKGVVPHLVDYAHKVRTGSGRVNSPHLAALSQQAPKLVEPRAAENYSPTYKKLLNQLGLPGGGEVTVQQMATALFTQANFQPVAGSSIQAFTEKATNRQLGLALRSYCAAAEAHNAHPTPNEPMSPKTLSELRSVAKSLIADGMVQRGRIFREKTVTPAQLDGVMNSFKSGASGQGASASPSLERSPRISRESQLQAAQIQHGFAQSVSTDRKPRPY